MPGKTGREGKLENGLKKYVFDEIQVVVDRQQVTAIQTTGMGSRKEGRKFSSLVRIGKQKP